MNIRGYMLEITWDGHTLTATGTTKAARIALRGQHHDTGPLVLERSQIAGIDLKPASMLTNGRLTLHTSDGSSYLLHFRRKQSDNFTQLAAQLQHPQPA